MSKYTREANKKLRRAKQIDADLHEKGKHHVKISRTPAMRRKKAFPNGLVNQIQKGTALIVCHGKRSSTKPCINKQAGPYQDQQPGA